MYGVGLTDMVRAFRLAAAGAAVLAVAAVAVGAALGYLLAGVAVAIGLGLGVLNGLLLQRSTARVGVLGRRRSAFDTIGRLGGVTLAVVAVIWLLGRPGFGAVFGVAIFQVVMLAAMSRVLLRQIRRERLG